ncbi:MAG TPA: tRNA (adenosine(37)-N6)-dimethylallyltransferase MiaA [Gemmatimonadaceae bacterium]|jgi:tRNA dimethylallyltransferase
MSSSADSDGAELRIVCGPTAAGKSAVAMALAERHGLTIVSADSRQIYRGFDVGTAKPSAADRKRVPHLGVDVADATERWSAAKFASDAAGWIATNGAARTLVVGGTGFYLRALTEPLDPSPPLHPAVRAKLASELETVDTENLRRWVRELDPARAHLGRTQLLRAAEVALLTGHRLSDYHRDAPEAAAPRARWLVVDPGDRLHGQIAHRLDAMLGGGWPDEVRALERTVPADAPAWQACGYDSVRQLVAGTLGASAARDAILIATRQYAKRQRTWFRHQLESRHVTRLDPHDPSCDAIVERWWRGGERE